MVMYNSGVLSQDASESVKYTANFLKRDQQTTRDWVYYTVNAQYKTHSSANNE